MFSFFKKKEAGIKVNDRIWISESAKLSGCLNIIQQKPNAIFVVWFTETLLKLNDFLEQFGYSNCVLMYRETHAANSGQYYFAEHYPLRSKENELFTQLGLQEVTVLSSLDEPLFMQFGGDRIIDVMKKMGMNDNEAIEHNMIASSIEKAQRKIAERVTIDNTAGSQKEWFARNMNK